jgi:hypothetical protein
MFVCTKLTTSGRIGAVNTAGSTTCATTEAVSFSTERTETTGREAAREAIFAIGMSGECDWAPFVVERELTLDAADSAQLRE